MADPLCDLESVAHVDDVINEALVRKPDPIEWTEPPEPVVPTVQPEVSLPH